jgi:hypothetical protein
VRIGLADVTSTYSTVSEAPDFSLPDTSNKYPNRDPLDDTRAIRPGEIFFLTPISATNKDSVARWIEVRLLAEDGGILQFGRAIVPAGDTAFIPVQGRSLFKRDPAAAVGDRIQVIAEVDNMFDVWGSAEEKLSNEHVGVA